MKDEAKLKEQSRLMAQEVWINMKKFMRRDIDTDWYKVVERLLRVYKAMKHRVEYLSEYEFEPRGKSASIITYTKNDSGPKSFDDIREEAVEERKRSYARTFAEFEEFNSVVREFENEPEFKVIRMYYFNEDKDGRPLPTGERLTLDQIAFDLGRETNTIRRWRTDIIQRMALVLKSTDAAVSIVSHSEKKGDKTCKK